ncbi:MAG: ABC-type multidrug transport system, ATPase component, partial [uncultured bacterium]
MLKVENITKSFGNLKAVDGVSFEAKDGEVVGLLGPNGAGKTTTMRVITGFISPDEGNVEIDTVSIRNNPIQVQSKIGYLPENNPLYKEMLVSEMLEFSADMRNLTKIQRKDAIDFSVNASNIKDVYYKPINELSKGFKQRVGLAVALLHKPKTLVLDEPTEGLDPNQRSEI